MKSSLTSFVLLVSLACVLPLARSQEVQPSQVILLGDIVAGGDGTGNAPAENTGIDPRNGRFVQDYIFDILSDDDAGGDGLNPSPTDSPFIDSVFFIFGFNFEPERTDFIQPVTQSLVFASFQKSDSLGGGFNYILKDRNGGTDALPVRIGGIDGITDLGVGIHSSMGLTFNLDALRAVHGPEKVGCFNSFWGMDSCPGFANLYVYLSSDAEGVIDERHFWGAGADNAELIHVEIPASAQYLTLAAGMEGDTFCDHGTFGQAMITESPCLESNLLALLHAGPRHVSTDGGTEVVFVGENLTAQYEYLIGGTLVENLEPLDSKQVRGFTPHLNPGIHDIVVRYPEGEPLARISNVFEAGQPIQAFSIEPSLVYPDGSSFVSIRGQYFRAETTVTIGDYPLVDPSGPLEDGTLITGYAPALAPGDDLGHRHVYIDDPFGSAFLDDAIQYVELPPAPVLTLVEPSEVLADGTTQVAVLGGNFLAETEVWIGGRPLLDPALDLESGGTRITGVAPPLDLGEEPGPRDVLVADSRGQATLEGGVVYVESPDDLVPGPQEIEGTLAVGTARFSWHNPAPYSKILVLDDFGTTIGELAGDATRLEVDALGERRVQLKLQGIAESDRVSLVSEAIASALRCRRPAPLTGNGLVGKLEFSLYGDHEEAAVVRCVDPPGGGGGADAGAGALAARGSGGGFVQLAHRVGYLRSMSALSLFPADSNQFTTGFTLPEASDKLEIAVYVQKIATDLGVELRGKLTHIDPDDGFVDEFTFPEIRIDAPKDWISLTYYRADRDVGHVGDPEDPLNPPPASCGLQIPAGDYLLDIYTVEGDVRLPYFVLADDGRDEELLIRGSPCPPYPLVKVTDVTGFATLPDVFDITAQPAGRWSYALASCPAPDIAVTFRAAGTWTDEASNVHPLTVQNPSFEYIWTIRDRPVPTKISSGSSSVLRTCIRDYGCYEMDLEVRDRNCGISKKRTLEVIVLPDDPTCVSPYYSFLSPTPEPGGIYALAGLNPGPGNGKFQGVRPVNFRVLVVPQCHCVNPKDPGCRGAMLGDFEFRLAVRNPGLPVTYTGLSAAIVVEDACPDQASGAKYFNVRIEDLGAIPTVPTADYPNFRDVHFQARALRVNGSSVSDAFQNVGAPLHMANRPTSLGNTYWSGYFLEGDASYHFVTKSSPRTQESFDIGPSQAIPLPGLPVTIQSYDNDLASGFTSRFMMQSGVWSPEAGTGATSGEILSNKLDAAPVQVAPKIIQSGDGAGGALGPPVYEWCRHVEILNNQFSQTLFEAILYTGTIGPIPVTVWASIGLGLDYKVESQVNVKVSPFAPAVGGNFAETHFYLLSSVDIAIPCEIRADILFGIASVAARLIPEANFEMDTHIWSADAGGSADLFIGAFLSLYFEIEACLNLLITEVCFSPGRATLIDREPLIPQVGTKPNVVACTGGGAGEIAGGDESSPFLLDDPRGQGADTINFQSYVTTSAPTTARSPDGRTTIDAWIGDDGAAKVYVNGVANAVPGGDSFLGDFRDPVATFLSNTEAIIAWTQSFPIEAGVPLSSPAREDRNKIACQEEIVISPVRLVNQALGIWSVDPHIRIADIPAEVPDPLDRRADGRAHTSADRAAAQAIVVWVRYETPDFLIDDGMKTVPVPNGPAQEHINRRPQLEKTAIFARRVDFSGALEPALRLSPEADGINIEPIIAVAPSGNTAYAVWVHDGTPGRKDLIESNRGRIIAYSVYSKATDTWSPAASVLADPAEFDTLYPGSLEPHLSLKDDLTGLLAFTALDRSSSERDTGLGGGSRLVYAARLEGGVFGTPFFVHGKCQRRTYGHWVTTHWEIPDLIDPESRFKWKHPDWVMTWLGHGEIGVRPGSGDVMVSVLGRGQEAWTEPVSLTPDANIHSNIAASLSTGMLRTINLNGGPASLGARLRAGRGVGAAAGDRVFEVVEVRLEPDAAIAACDLSDAFPPPGSEVIALVRVENRGLAGTPLDEGDASILGLRATFIAEDGTESIVAQMDVPEIAPGETIPVELLLEMPHDPVRLRVELDPNPIDRNLENNSKELFLGAPAPRSFGCERITLGDEAGRSAVKLHWENTAIYDEIILYRDGSMFTAIPGACLSFVDLYALESTRLYEARGRIGASKSVKAVCDLTVVPDPGFRRGDVNGDGQLNITDAIVSLGYQFLGQGTPPCLKALDADDNGNIQITDPILSLGYLFLGGRPPAAPFPDCGLDPTADDLSCEGQGGCP